MLSWHQNNSKGQTRFKLSDHKLHWYNGDDDHDHGRCMQSLQIQVLFWNQNREDGPTRLELPNYNIQWYYYHHNGNDHNYTSYLQWVQIRMLSWHPNIKARQSRG